MHVRDVLGIKYLLSGAVYLFRNHGHSLLKKTITKGFEDVKCVHSMRLHNTLCRRQPRQKHRTERKERMDGIVESMTVINITQYMFHRQFFIRENICFKIISC